MSEQSLCAGLVRSPRVRSVVEQIDALIALDTMAEQTNELKRASLRARTMIGNLLPVRAEVDEAIRFFSRGNLEILTLWVNDRSYDNSTHTVGAGTLLIADGNTDSDIRIARPPGLLALKPEVFEEMQAASAVFTRPD